MYDDYEERIVMMPASSVAHFHNAFAGGYVDHILRVMKCTQKLYTAWSDMGADMSGYTKEEMMFAAMHHDLGKVGDMEHDYYTPEDSDWHRKNTGSIFKYNPKLTIPKNAQPIKINGTPIDNISLWNNDNSLSEQYSIYPDTYKKDKLIIEIIYYFIELYFRKNISIKNISLLKSYHYFLEKINNTRTYNLDEEILFMEFEDKILNG